MGHLLVKCPKAKALPRKARAGRKQKVKKKGKEVPGLQRAWVRATKDQYDGKVDLKAANAALKAALAQEIPPDDLIRARKMAQAAKVRVEHEKKRIAASGEAKRRVKKPFGPTKRDLRRRTESKMWKAQAQKMQHEYPEMRSLQLARQGHTTSATKRIAREEARAEASNRVERARKRAKSIKQFEETKKDEAAAILARHSPTQD